MTEHDIPTNDPKPSNDWWAERERDVFPRREPPTIEHNKYEFPNNKWPWWSKLLGIYCWVFFIFFYDLSWWTVGLGFTTGYFAGIWHMEETGGRS